MGSFFLKGVKGFGYVDGIIYLCLRTCVYIVFTIIFMKSYQLRVYIEDEKRGLFVGHAIEIGAMAPLNSFAGVGECLWIYDVVCERWVIELLLKYGVPIFPLDNYGDFDITFCGEPIEDDMILKIYDNRVLSGCNVEKDGICGKAVVLLR